MGAVLKISNYTKKGFTQDIKSDTLFLNDTFEAAKRMENASKKVLPFDSIDEINRVIYELAKRSMRDVCLFVMGCNTQLRVSDLLDFRWKDILDQSTGDVKEEVSKIEKKNKNLRHIYINDAIKLAVNMYRNTLPSISLHDYMFTSQGPRKNLRAVAYNGDVMLQAQPITEQLVSGIIRSATKKAGIWTANRRFSTHSMRKTGARAAAGYLTGRDLPENLRTEAASIERVRGMLGHSSAQTTARYIDLQDKFDKTVYLWMNLGIEALTNIKNNIK